MKTFVKEKVGILALGWLVFAVGIAGASDAFASQRDSGGDTTGATPPDAAQVQQIMEQQLLEVQAEQRIALQNTLLAELESAMQIQPEMMDFK